LTEQQKKSGQEELEAQEGRPLPDREVMSVLTPDPTAEPGFGQDQPLPPDAKPPLDWINDPPEQNEPLKGGEGL